MAAYDSSLSKASSPGDVTNPNADGVYTTSALGESSSGYAFASFVYILGSLLMFYIALAYSPLVK